MKLVLRIMMVLVLVAVIAIGRYLWTPSAELFDAADAFEAAKAYDARIIRDRYGVPHVYGERDADVAFGLAYAHAEDDIENIQDTHRLVRGEMALKTGFEGAISDYLMAALGASKAVETRYESDLSPEVRALVSGYVAGINLFCAEKASRCERGFAPVQAQDIVAAFTARTPFFYGLDGEILRLFEGDLDLIEAADASREAYYKTDNRITPGSNAMAVAPSRSSDGHTRLFVNSHQPFVGTVAWYEARLKSEEGWDIVGGLFPGTPMVTVGANPHLGWAMTVNKPDLMDAYKLTVNDEKAPTKYLFDGSWLDFETETVTIRVKLLGPFSFPAKRTIRRSIHGPVFDTPNGFFAVSFVGDGDIRAVEQWLDMNKARSFEAWKSAMEMQAIPSFNVVYADKEGNIAHFYNAAIPQRSGDQDWSQVAQGDRSELIWLGVHPFGTAPSVVNPASGYVVNSNNSPFNSTAEQDRPVRANFPPHYGINDGPTNRGLRAQALYGGDDEITEEEFLAYKLDTKFDPASAIMTHLRALAGNPDIAGNPDYAEALALFSDWDGNVTDETRVAGLAIRATQLANGVEMRGDGAEVPDHEAALAQAIAEYMEGFGRIDPLWSEVNRLKRGDLDVSVRGAPDVLRAIYSIDNPKDGPLNAIAGDSYILYSDWDEAGAQTVRTIHQYGSATQDESSPHYADQVELFAAEEYKTPPLELDALLVEATRDYRPGRDDAAN